MDERFLKHLADRFGYETWRVLAGDDVVSVISGAALGEGDIRGWTVARQTRDAVDSQPRLRLILRRTGSSANQLISITIVECPSVPAARAYLLRWLGDFQSPLVVRLPKTDSGEVAFGMGETMVLFSRANLIVHVANAGREIIPVLEIARAVDNRLILAAGRQNQSGQP
ncbi:MAG TPA: hypothetical protein VFO25_08300 [Candidatus Eremiobacteraceae bacterium]|nr:hypothetical protein [Candidatus Eremiobacteraceae bacterium]